jgi:clusterin-associated protein 1
MYDFVSKETVNREARSQMSKPMELSSVEKLLRHAISNLKNQIENGKVTLDSQVTDKVTLDSKIQRKQSELERSSHRLQTLQKIRPAYLEEFEKIEVQMKDLYTQYTMKIRCYDALKNMLSNNSNHSPTSYSPIQKAHDTSIPVLPEEEGLTDDDEDEGDNNSENFKDDQSLLNQDIFKQVSNRLTRGDRKPNENEINRNLKVTTEDMSATESSPSSDDLESGELDFSELTKKLLS